MMVDRSDGKRKRTWLFDLHCRDRFLYEIGRAKTLAPLERPYFDITEATRQTIKERTSFFHRDFLQSVYSHANLHFPSLAQCDLVDSSLQRQSDASVPQSPLWIEPTRPLFTYLGRVAGFFFYDPEQQYSLWIQKISRNSLLYKSMVSRILSERGWFVLEAIDDYGHIIMDIRYNPVLNKWKFSYPHVCSRTCQYAKGDSSPRLQPCSICAKTLDRIVSWFTVYYRLYNTGEINALEHQESIKKDNPVIQPPIITKKEKPPKRPKQPKLKNVVYPPPPSRFYTSFPEPIPPKLPPQRSSSTHPSVASHPLLFERSLLKNKNIETILLQSHKYLWMHSAWAMSEYLCQSDDEQLLRLPPHPVYIELEQSQELYRQVVAAFSFLSVSTDRWRLSILSLDGETVWNALYEHSQWVLPQSYACPEGMCRKVTLPDGAQFDLCPLCQERITHHTSWITVALRMIAGDYQEQVELREPVYVTERSGTIRHRYRVIHYLNACAYRGIAPQALHGSWMAGRPFAQSEYEVNPDAIIYVQIPVREHNRTFSSERYINMKGKTKHIGPLYRLQPMTIATYRQLGKPRLITHVTASLFE